MGKADSSHRAIHDLPRPDLTVYLGRRVTVTVDRPLGTRHPEHRDIYYSLNYGYITGTVSGDGDPIDAYLVGIFEPLDRFLGVVIAIVLRADDDEDKLVVAPEGIYYSTEQLEALLEFQERFFQSKIVLAHSPQVGL